MILVVHPHRGGLVNGQLRSAGWVASLAVKPKDPRLDEQTPAGVNERGGTLPVAEDGRWPIIMIIVNLRYFIH